MPQTTNTNDEREVRIKKLTELRELNINPYPAKSVKKNTLQEALDAKEGTALQVAGRVMTMREMGKLTFCHLQDESAKMQIALKDGDIDKENYKLFIKKIDIGDIISIEGERF